MFTQRDRTKMEGCSLLSGSFYAWLKESGCTVIPCQKLDALYTEKRDRQCRDNDKWGHKEMLLEIVMVGSAFNKQDKDFPNYRKIVGLNKSETDVSSMW